LARKRRKETPTVDSGGSQRAGNEVLAQLKRLTGSSLGETAENLQTEELKMGLESFLRKVELYQMLNLHPPEGSDRFYLFLPFWLGSHLQFVELNLSFPRKKSARGEREQLSLLFLLQLPVLGKVRIEVQIKDKDLFCRLMVADLQISELFCQGLSDLSVRLQRMGYYPHLQLSVEPAEKLNETSVSNLESESQHLFNIII